LSRAKERELLQLILGHRRILVGLVLLGAIKRPADFAELTVATGVEKQLYFQTSCCQKNIYSKWQPKNEQNTALRAEYRIFLYLMLLGTGSG
jgi:hypothetical protein